MLYNAVFWICLLIFYFSLLIYIYYYNYRSHISLQVAKLAKSVGVQILIFPTVYGGSVAAAFGPPEIHDQLLRLLHIEDEIVRGAPCCDVHSYRLVSSLQHKNEC